MKSALIFADRSLTLPRLVPLLFIALFISVAYYPSLGVPFLFDDFPNISQNPAVQPDEAGDFLKVFQSEVSRSRPLALFSFAVNFWFHGLDVVGYHYVNILIHIANAALLYFLLLRLPWGGSTTGEAEPGYDSRRRTLIFLAVLLWALNPVQTQAVSYIVQRMTSLATFFYLAALLSFCRFRQGDLPAHRAMLVIGLCFVLGLASKEMIITLPAGLLLFDLCFFNRRPARKEWLLLALAGAVILLAGYLYLGNRLFPDWHAVYPNRNFTPWQRLMTQWRILWHYLEIFAWPQPSRLQLTYDPVISRGLLTPWTTLAGLLAIPAALAGAWLLRHRHPLAACAIFFYFLTQAVESTHLNLEVAFIHRLYISSLFLPAALISMIPTRFNRYTGLACLLLIGLWSYWTVERNVEWQHPESFWLLEAQRGGGRARALNNQARWQLDRQKSPDLAIATIREGLKQATSQDRMLLLYNLAIAQKQNRDYPASLATWKQLLEEYGIIEEAMLYIGDIYLQQNKNDKVEDIVRRIQSNKEIAYQATILQAALAGQKGDHQQAVAILKEGLRNAESTQARVQIHNALAQAYVAQKLFDEAYLQYLAITRLDPSIDAAWQNIALMMKASGREKQSEVITRFLESQKDKERK